MAYETTATRKRPSLLSELAGQEFTVAALTSSLKDKKIAHAYMFSGPRGCGKTSAARILARALNCQEGESAQPCGVCKTCEDIAHGKCFDVIEIDGASNTSVDNIRKLKDEVLFPPYHARYKVYIIDEVHMLSTSAFNALLKTIEEPPAYIVFIFATTEIHKVPATIKSRCQQYSFKLLRLETITGLLAKVAAEDGLAVDADALLWIARESGGSMRDAYTLYDQLSSCADGRLSMALIRDKLKLTGNELVTAIVRACSLSDSRTALELVDDVYEQGTSSEQFVAEMAERLRMLFAMANNIENPTLLGALPQESDHEILSRWNAEQLESAFAIILGLFKDIRYCLDQRFEIELAVSRLCRIGSSVNSSELSKAIVLLRSWLAQKSAGHNSAAQKSAMQQPARQGPAPFGGDRASPSVRQTDPELHNRPFEREESSPALPAESPLSDAFSRLSHAISGKDTPPDEGNHSKAEAVPEKAAPPKQDDSISLIEKVFKGKRL